MFGALLAAHIAFFDREALLTAIAVALLAGRLTLFREPKDLAIATLVAGLEAGVEVSLAQPGLFAYAHASLGPLPLWHLPFWAGLGVCIRGFFRAADPVLSQNRTARYGAEHVAPRSHHAA